MNFHFDFGDFVPVNTHPNAFGATLYFIEPERQGDVHVFASRGHDPKEDLKWVLVGAHILTHFADAMDRLEAVLPALSERGRLEAPWKPPATRQDRARCVATQDTAPEYNSVICHTTETVGQVPRSKP